MITALTALLGNRTASKVLLYIAVNRDGYAQEIADRIGVSLNLVQSQLKRLERGGVLVSRPRGRMRFFSFNPRFPLADSLRQLLQQALDFLPDEEREQYLVRRRPRAPAKRIG